MKRLLDYLKVNELRDGYLYRIAARNASCGIWTKRHGGFVISRNKFGSNYLFIEYHWDVCKWHGTVKPFNLLEKAPFNEGIFSDMWNVDMNPAIYRHILGYLNGVIERFNLDEWYRWGV